MEHYLVYIPLGREMVELLPMFFKIKYLTYEIL